MILMIRIWSIAMILIGVSLLVNFGCYMLDTKSKYDIPDHFISLDNRIRLVELDSGLETIILNQIAVDSAKFAKEDYVEFSNNPSFPGIREPWKSSRIEIFDIYVDYRLLNKFIFVLTQQNTDEIIGSIQQAEPIEQPKKDLWYYITYEQIWRKFGEGVFDIYGFHNDALVFKNVYSPNELLRRQNLNSP